MDWTVFQAYLSAASPHALDAQHASLRRYQPEGWRRQLKMVKRAMAIRRRAELAGSEKRCAV